MSFKLPRVTAADVIRVIEQVGFRFSRQTGSHKIYKDTRGGCQ
ncbi:MAG: type II toxin-antitoxin system HicA family toxin [Candidatus Hydrogenedentota bacterium]